MSALEGLMNTINSVLPLLPLPYAARWWCREGLGGRSGSIVGLGFVVVLVLGAFGKLDPLIDVGDAFLRFARRVRDFFGGRGPGRGDEENYKMPDLGPLPPDVPALPLNRTDSDYLAEARISRSTCV